MAVGCDDPTPVLAFNSEEARRPDSEMIQIAARRSDVVQHEIVLQEALEQVIYVPALPERHVSSLSGSVHTRQFDGSNRGTSES